MNEGAEKNINDCLRLAEQLVTHPNPLHFTDTLYQLNITEQSQ